MCMKEIDKLEWIFHEGGNGWKKNFLENLRNIEG